MKAENIEFRGLLVYAYYTLAFTPSTYTQLNVPGMYDLGCN